jgi:ribosomal protein S27E
MTIVEKAAYLKGLCEGLGVDPDSRDGKLWGALNELLSDMAHEIEDLQSGSLDFADTLDEFGDELSYLEELTCDLDRPEDMDDEFCSGDCESCEYDCFSDEEDEGEEDEDEDEDEDDGEPGYDGVLYDVKCPVCGEEITFDEDTLEEGSIECPKCGETLEFDLSGEDK